MTTLLRSGILCLLLLSAGPSAAELAVSNVRAAQRPDTKLVDIDYDLSATEPFVHVTLEVSADGGQTYAVPATALSGATGGAVRPGLNRRLTWDAGKDWNGQLSSQVQFRVNAETGPPGFAIIPAGTFQMGDNYRQGQTNELPVHQVYVSRFLMSRYEITHEQMRAVLQWAYDRGLVSVDATTVTNTEGTAQPFLSFTAQDDGRQATYLRFSNGSFYIEHDKGNFPMGGVTWYGALAYCNYRSEMEGLPRSVNFADWSCDFSKTGYRLPTEAEWEKAARGGLTGHHHSWPSFGGHYNDHIAGHMAKYNATWDPWRFTSYYWTTPVGYFDGNQMQNGIRTGADMANGYGLYDMLGNVWEWCWDNWQADWYAQPGATQPDTIGPVLPYQGHKVIRGGSYGYNSWAIRVACRHVNGWSPAYVNFPVGFRPVRRDP